MKRKQGLGLRKEGEQTNRPSSYQSRTAFNECTFVSERQAGAGECGSFPWHWLLRWSKNWEQASSLTSRSWLCFPNKTNRIDDITRARVKTKSRLGNQEDWEQTNQRVKNILPGFQFGEVFVCIRVANRRVLQVRGGAKPFLACLANILTRYAILCGTRNGTL